MNRIINPIRLAFFSLLIMALVIVYLMELYRLQIIEGNAYYDASINSIVLHETVTAARGKIIDRYGRVLVENRQVHNLVIDEKALFGTEGLDPNAAILDIVNLLTEYGNTYTDTLPITRTPPFEYTEMTDIQRVFLEAYLNDKGLDANTSAVELMAYMRDRYRIDNGYTGEETRIIAGIRYEINGRYSRDFATADYIFAQDVSLELIIRLKEMEISGFDVSTSYVREYNTPCAAHILGYTGPMTAEEYAAYQKLGYPLNATVGKSGAELAFESMLHGTDGEARITRNKDGIETSRVYTVPPEQGNNVYLTLDIGLQAKAESTLASYIENTNSEREVQNTQLMAEGNLDDVEELITGGAIVAVDVHTGEPLCIANYPTYDLTTFLEDYSALLTDESHPLVNRALSGLYSPGSTFKPLMALAALNENIISGEDQITCAHIFDKYQDAGYAPRCTGIHGPITVSEALAYSCNVFFYAVGDTMGIDLIDKYAYQFGLGQATGIELFESPGRMASPETKAALFDGTVEASWFAADTLLTSIGQSVTGVTPIQLARYTAAIANSGTTYNCSILKTATSYDYSERIYERKTEVLSTVDAPEYVWTLVHEGMRDAVRLGTAYLEFYDFPYTVAAKTGTTETGSASDDAFFICYAPYENPEIAIAVALENGAHGSSLAGLARDVLEYYFTFKEHTNQEIESELTLLP